MGGEDLLLVLRASLLGWNDCLGEGEGQTGHRAGLGPEMATSGSSPALRTSCDCPFRELSDHENEVEAQPTGSFGKPF